jgi:hypothetical protein
MLESPGMEQLRQRVIAAHHLEPLTLEETRAYIEYRLACVNWSGSPALTDSVFERVHHFCAGVPRRINAVCDRLLLFGCIEEKPLLGGADVDVVAAEIGSEVGRAGDLSSRRAGGDAGSSPFADPGGTAPADWVPPVGDGVAARLAAVEAQLATLQQTVRRERQLLRKAVLLQLDLRAFDDLD